MEVVPAVDILGGECVQLVGGDPATKKTYGDPIEVAERWINAGAKLLHLVDLDAALGSGSNLDLILKIKERTSVPVQVGGGVRSIDDARHLLEGGVNRIVLGTLAVQDREQEFKVLEELKIDYTEERLIVALDSRGGQIVVKGWQAQTPLTAAAAVKSFEPYCWGFLYTDVDVEGQMRGINLEGIKKVVGATKKPVIASGGITTLDDVEKIKEAGAWGIVLGKALYEGKLRLEDVV